MDPWIKRSPEVGWPLPGGHRVPVGKEPSSLALLQPREKEINERKRRIPMWIMSFPMKGSMIRGFKDSRVNLLSFFTTSRVPWTP
jgi:hypothetical protein